MKTKDLLKKYISDDLFEDLSCFVEELYLMDIDYLILMARKFYNLFWVFHELNCEKYKETGVPFHNKIKVVSDRALPVLNHLLKEGGCRVVIGDDIIIHGRGIRDLYNRILNVCPDIDINIESFIINNDDTSVYEDIKEKIRCCYEGSTDKWRDVSDRIVATFLLSGRPYISYLPYFTLDMTWTELFEKLSPKECVSVSNYDLQYYGVDLSVYYGRKIDFAQKLNCCEMAAVRFYNYKQVGKVMAIPYFCSELLDDDSIQRLSNMFRNELFTSEYNKKVDANDGADSMRLMEIEYTMSLLLAESLFSDAGIKVKDWPREIETGAFSDCLIKYKKIEELDYEKILRKVTEIDERIKKRAAVVPNNEEEFLEKYNKIKEQYRELFKNDIKKRNWLGKNNDVKDYLAQYIEKILFINGNIDEARCKSQNNEEKSRLLGMPVSFILSDSADFWCSLDGSKDKDYFRKLLFAEMIQAIDTGKGSIVIRTFRDQEDVLIRESFLHAGEQNYKYYESTNYPFMYGLMIIEHNVRKKDSNKNVEKMKKLFQELYDAYLDRENIIYAKEEQDDLLKLTILSEFGRFLLDKYEKHKNNDVLAMAKEYAQMVVAEV